MVLNDDQLRELGLSKMGYRSTIIQEQGRPPLLVAVSLQPNPVTWLSLCSLIAGREQIAPTFH
jgi:hypothetical protein